MDGFDLKYAAVKLLRMITSRKFLVLLFAALLSSGLEVTPEWQGFIILAAAGLYAALTAYEDKSV